VRDVARSVCLSVCSSQPRAIRKNSWTDIDAVCMERQTRAGPMNRVLEGRGHRRHLANTVEYEYGRTIRARRRCVLMSNYCDHLLLFTLLSHWNSGDPVFQVRWCHLSCNCWGVILSDPVGEVLSLNANEFYFPRLCVASTFDQHRFCYWFSVQRFFLRPIDYCLVLRFNVKLIKSNQIWL